MLRFAHKRSGFAVGARVAAGPGLETTARFVRVTKVTPRAREQASARRISDFPWSPLALVIAAMIFVACTDGGRKVRLPSSAGGEFAEVARKIGLGIEGASVTGYRHTADSDIYKALQLDQNNLLFAFDAVAARKRIEALPWIDKASVTRVFPNSLKVVVSERAPYALWMNGNRTLLVDSGGRTLGPADPAEQAGLPVVAGPGAGERAQEIVNLVGKQDWLRGRIRQARLVDGRRWSVLLQGGAVLDLPADGAGDALSRLAGRGDRDALLSTRYGAVDLRLDSYLVVRPTKVRG